MARKRVGVLISGRGSNMMALVEAARADNYPAEIALVASNKADAAGLDFAAANGIKTAVVSHREFETREAFDAALNAVLQHHNLDIICCAGFMRIMTPTLISPWEGRMLNIHPSLLPLYKGLHTHERAIADGQTEAGCTVHLVTAELDGGPIIAQSRVPVFPGETAEMLAARVLIEEHKLYPKVLAKIANSISATV
jgi:phosphoribosylglycinamide formyltransferase-1